MARYELLIAGSITDGTTGAIAAATCANAGAVTVQITGTWVATLAFEATVDGTNWFAVNAVPPTTGIAVTSTTANGDWVIALPGFRQVRVRASAYTSGTAVVNFGLTASGVMAAASLATGAVTVADGADVAVGTTTDAAVTDPTASATVIALLKGAIKGFTPANITTATTTVVHSGAGVVHGVSINSLGGTSTAKLYDNTAGSGTVIGTINTASAVGFVQLDAAFATGLTVVTADGGSHADITVTWR